MMNIFLTELLRHRKLAIGFAIVHLLLLYVMLIAMLSPSVHHLTEHAWTMLLTSCKSGMLAPS